MENEAQEAPDLQTEESESNDQERGAGLKELGKDELLELALKYRDEAAANRKKGNAKVSEAQQKLEEVAKKWQEYQDSQKTEAQKQAEKLAELENELSEYRTQQKAKAIASKVKNFPMDLLDVLHGSEDSMLAQAEKLAKREAELAKKSSGSIGDRAGDRGTPVRPSVKGGGGFLEELDPQKRK